jgi:hypothetical protein
MELRKFEWQEQGYHLMLVEAKRGYFHLFVSRDRREYAIYDRFHATSMKAACSSIRFNPCFYEAMPPAFPITREAAMAGETGIPYNLEVLVRHMESNWPGVTLGRN